MIYKKYLFVVICLLFNYTVGAQYQDVFDQVVRSRFSVQTNRRLDLDGLNPYNIEKVIQEGQFLFIIGNDKGIYTNYPDPLEYVNAPDNPQFEQCLRFVARMYQKDVIFPYTIPIVIQHDKRGHGVAWCRTRYLRGIEKGNSKTWVGIDINWNIYERNDIHYILEENKSYEGLYLIEVIVHEIFHSFFDNVLSEHRYQIYPYSWTSDDIEEYEEGRYRPCADDLGLVSFFYVGENAMKANGGQPIQGYGNHLSNAFQVTDDKFFACNLRKNIAINHLGPVSLGIMKDNGFELKEGISFERDFFTGYLFDKVTEQAYAWVSEGDTTYFNHDDVSYGIGPRWDMEYPLSNEIIRGLEPFNIYTRNEAIYIDNYEKMEPVVIFDISGHIILDKILPIGVTSIPVKPGIYIVNKGAYSKKIICR